MYKIAYVNVEKIRKKGNLLGQYICFAKMAEIGSSWDKSVGDTCFLFMWGSCSAADRWAVDRAAVTNRRRRCCAPDAISSWPERELEHGRSELSVAHSMDKAIDHVSLAK